MSCGNCSGSNSSTVLTSLEVRVDNHTALLKKIKEEYTGRLVDILDVSNGT